MNCIYSPKEGRLYDPAVDLPRDAAAIARLCTTAEIAKDNASAKKLMAMSIHPWISPLQDVPMGYDNNIFKTPPDLFHVFSAGLLKHAVIWVLTIVNTIGTLDEKYKLSLHVLDERLHNFVDTPTLPHVPNTVFNQGLSRIVTSKSLDEKGNATGSGGGFR